LNIPVVIELTDLQFLALFRF